jgi:hypothetical protein
MIQTHPVMFLFAAPLAARTEPERVYLSFCIPIEYLFGGFLPERNEIKF